LQYGIVSEQFRRTAWWGLMFLGVMACGASGGAGGSNGGSGEGSGGARSLGGSGGSAPEEGSGGTSPGLGGDGNGISGGANGAGGGAGSGAGGSVSVGSGGASPGGSVGTGSGGRDASGTGGSGAGASGTGGTAGVTGAAGSPGTFRVPFDWNGIVGNGQSLSVGSRGTPVITTTQPFKNVKLYDATGKYALDSSGTLSLVPLVELIRPVCPQESSPYPCNIYGETPHTALSIELTTLAKAAGAADYVTLHSVTGQGAQPLAVINKEGSNGTIGPAYGAALSEARSFKKFATAAGKTFGVIAIMLTHGETDNGFASTYESGVYKLYQDYNVDLPAITGQTQPIPLIASQQVSSPPTGNGLTNTALGGTALAIWHGGGDHPGQIICSGPKYQYKYYNTNSTTTDPHLYAAGYRRLGEKVAEVIDAVVNRGLAWQPLQPTGATVSGATVAVSFQVPNPPLAWEPSLAISTTVAAWKNGRGFEVVDSTGPLTINSADISGNSVVLTLAAAPRGSKLRVRYVTYNGCTTDCGDYLVGQLRDSDPLIGADVETISCAVTQGRTSLVCPSKALATREVHDLVTGTGFASDTVILSTDKSTKATLSNPWTGSSGTVSLRFAYDERNYAVQFDLAVD
jgi:hypothetical protein